MLYWKSTGSKWAGKTMKTVKLNEDPDNILEIAAVETERLWTSGQPSWPPSMLVLISIERAQVFRPR